MNIPSWLKSKIFWLNLIALVILVLQYAIDNNLVPAEWVPIEALIVVVLNAIANMITSNQVTGLRAKVKKLEASK